MEILPLVKIVDKWNRRVGIAQPEYEDGLKNPRRSWMDACLASVDTWEAAIQQAIRDGLWAMGIREASDTKWADRSLTLGVERWPRGVAVAQDDYRRGYEPYHSALQALTLPPRFARGDTRNYERVKAIGIALRKVKVGRGR